MVHFWKKAALVTATGAMALATAAPAQARWHGGYHGGWHGGYHHYHGGRTSAALLGGIVGLGVGAAIASRPYYGRGYYGGGYYGRPYYGGYYAEPAYAEPYYPAPRCWSEPRWDPYYGGYTRVRVCN